MREKQAWRGTSGGRAEVTSIFAGSVQWIHLEREVQDSGRSGSDFPSIPHAVRRQFPKMLGPLWIL